GPSRRALRLKHLHDRRKLLDAFFQQTFFHIAPFLFVLALQLLFEGLVLELPVKLDDGKVEGKKLLVGSTEIFDVALLVLLSFARTYEGHPHDGLVVTHLLREHAFGRGGFSAEVVGTVALSTTLH